MAHKVKINKKALHDLENISAYLDDTFGNIVANDFKIKKCNDLDINDTHDNVNNYENNNNNDNNNDNKNRKEKKNSSITTEILPHQSSTSLQLDVYSLVRHLMGWLVVAYVLQYHTLSHPFLLSDNR